MAIPPDVQAAFEEILEARRYAYHRRERLHGVRDLGAAIFVVTIWPFVDWIVSQPRVSVVEILASPGFYVTLVPAALFVGLLWYIESTSKRFKSILVAARTGIERPRLSPWAIAVLAILGGLMAVGMIELLLVRRSPRVLEPDFGLLFGFLGMLCAGWMLVIQGLRITRQQDVWSGILLVSAAILLLVARASGDLALVIGFGGTAAALGLRGLLQIFVPPRGPPA